MEASEEAIGAKHGFLGHVFRIAPTAQNPTREVECGIEMREHELLEALALLWIQHVRTLTLARRTHKQRPPEGQFYSQLSRK